MPLYADLPSSFHSKDNELYMKGEMIRNLPVAPRRHQVPGQRNLSECAAAAKESLMSDRKDAPPATTAKAQRAEPSLAELIAQTPGAQTREEALAHIAARERASAPKKRQTPIPSEEDLTKREPINIISDPYASAPEVIQRLLASAKAKQKEKPKAQPKQPKGSKLTLVRKDGKPVPPDKQ